MNQKENVRKLGDSLIQLFGLCGLEVRPMEIKENTGFIEFIRGLFENQEISNYLDNLAQQSHDAIHMLQESRKKERELEEKINELEQEKEKYSAKEEKLQSPLEGRCGDNTLEEMILNIISLRDSLLLTKDFLHNNDPDNESAEKIVNQQLSRTGKILKKAGVEILEDTGKYNPFCHKVEGTRPAPTEELAGTIAEVFRPGYIFQGKAIRCEEVILYDDI